MSNAEVREILQSAMELIADPDCWTQGESAIDSFGERIHPWDEHSVAYCSMGACEKVKYNYLHIDHYIGTSSNCDHPSCISRVMLELVAKEMGYKSPIALNDEGTHEDVMLMFKHAIEKVSDMA